MRDPLVGREVLAGVAAGTVGAFLIESRQFVPHLFRLPPGMTDLTGVLMLLGPRHVIAIALQTVPRALGIAIQIVGDVLQVPARGLSAHREFLSTVCGHIAGSRSDDRRAIGLRVRRVARR